MTIDDVKQKYNGLAGETVVSEVEKGSVKRYADAVVDLNPLYLDEEYAQKSRYGTIIAPPGFWGWPVKPEQMRPKILFEMLADFRAAGFPNILDGGIELEFMLPVRVGDVLVSLPRVCPRFSVLMMPMP